MAFLEIIGEFRGKFWFVIPKNYNDKDSQREMKIEGDLDVRMANQGRWTADQVWNGINKCFSLGEANADLAISALLH